MNTTISVHRSSERGGAILVYFILMGILISAIASLSVYVTQTAKLASRRSSMIAAQQYAEGAAVIACSDVRTAYTNSTFPASLLLSGYTLQTPITSQRTYTRTISSPFTNQTVSTQVLVPAVGVPASAKVITTAMVGGVPQTATVNLSLVFAYPAA